MSAGAVFIFLGNVGKTDRVILANGLLCQRIQNIIMRGLVDRDDTTPSLMDLELKHIIYVNAHFKPTSAIGYKYNNIKPRSVSETSW